MASSFIQTGFQGGELTPDLRGALDFPGYGKALSLMRNWTPLPEGAMARRNGTQDVCELQDQCGSRLIEFRTSSGKRFVVGLGEQVLRVYDETGDVNGGGGGGGPGPNLVTNGDFASGSTDWTLTAGAGGGQAYVSSGRAYVASGKETEYDPETGKLITIAYHPSSFAQTFNIAAPAAFRLVVTVLTAANLSISLRRGATQVFGTTITTPGTYSFAITVAVAGDHTLTFSSSSTTQAASSFDDIEFFSTGVGASLVAPWTAAQVGQIHHVLETGRDVLWLFHPNVETRQLKRDALGVWTLAAPTWVGKPAEWAGTNWPGTGELYQGRMFASGAPSQPSQVWASKSAAPEDFSPGTGQPTDGFSFKAQTKGAIRWLKGASPAALIIGTDLGEYHATAQGGVLMAGDIEVEPASSFASSAVQAIQVGHRVVYASLDAKRLRAMTFSRDVENWVSHDLSFSWRHLISSGVAELHFTREPIPMLVARTAAGELVAGVLDEAAGISAGWRVQTDGLVRSCVVLNSSDGSTVWLAVERRNGVRLEKWTIDAEDDVQVDAYVKAAVPVDLTITGLGHLEGDQVEIVLDGAVEPRQVVTGGQVVLAREGTEVVIGLPFSALARGLPKDVRAGKARSPRLGVQVVDSALPLVNGWRPPDRTPATPQDQAEPARSVKAKVRSLGFDDEAKFEIEQDLPFRTKVLSVFEVTQVSQL